MIIMKWLSKIFYKDVDSIQTTFNEDSEGIGGEIDVSSTEKVAEEG